MVYSKGKVASIDSVLIFAHMAFRLPYTILPNQDSEFAARWQRQFVRPGRDVEVGMWRREDDTYTAQKFGVDPESRRRRLVRFTHKYGLVSTEEGTNNFALTHTYLWVSTGLPKEDCADYWARVIDVLEKYNDWVATEKSPDTIIFKNGELTLHGQYILTHPQDELTGKPLPENYHNVEISIASSNAHELPKYDEDSWRNYAQRHRRGLSRGIPQVTNDLAVLKNYFPMHVMLGCGPSIEAGIPPLHGLHSIYCVGQSTLGKGFIFGSEDTMITDVVSDPEAFYEKVAGPYKSCMNAPVTKFYELIQDWVRNGLAVTPVINNNFDGLLPLLGVEEKFIRRFEMPDYIPDIQYSSHARALLVVGNHADRRRVVEGARKRGLQIIFVDPEGYYAADGVFTPYPIEDIQNEDLLFRMTAEEFATLASEAL